MRSSRYYSFFLKTSPRSTKEISLKQFFFSSFFFNVLLLHGGLEGWSSRGPTRSRKDVFAVGSGCSCVVGVTARGSRPPQTRRLSSVSSGSQSRSGKEPEERRVPRGRASSPRRRRRCPGSDLAGRRAHLWGQGVLCGRIPLFREAATVGNERRGAGN
uniref:Rhodanese domain-containing protein n=1 Tax=Molossus molossus TaxID=27622 RepID=A0A7J8GQR9_MOLMO|nr:hypothetical protein HJG59_011384 [Molossus molossus]